MVIPLGAPEVADLVHHSIESVVHGCWLFSFVEDELTEFSLDCFPLSDLGDFSPSCAVLRISQISLALFNPCTLLYSSLHKEVRSMEVAWELKCLTWAASLES
jgi:hypothetical protein